MKQQKLFEELLVACVRMIVGINKESKPNCEWYEGIECDGADEAERIIVKIKGD